MNWRDGESNPKIQQHSAAFIFQRFDHSAALKTERKMSHLNIAFDRYASVGTVLHYILVISDLCIYISTKYLNYLPLFQHLHLPLKNNDMV